MRTTSKLTIAAFSLLLVADCSTSTKETSKASAPPQTAPRAAAKAAHAPANAAAKTASIANPAARSTGSLSKISSGKRIAAGLGAELVGRLRSADEVHVARLGKENPRVAESKRLRGAKRIGGYPIRATSKKLTGAETKALVTLLFADATYLDLERRCANTKRLGVRFGDPSSAQRIDVVLGKPCDQLVFFWSHEGSTKSWGSVVTPAVGEALARLIRTK